MSDNRTPSSPGDKKSGFINLYAIVIGAFFAMMACGIVLFSFGVFFKPVSAEFGWMRAETSGAFSLMVILSGFLGIIAGRLGDRFKPSLVIISCGIIEGIAILLMSQIHALWQLYLYYGILIGIGMSNIAPTISLVTRSYTKGRATMIGITIAGASVGAAFASPVATHFISVNSWQTSFMVIGGIVMALVAISAFFFYYPGVARQPVDEIISSTREVSIQTKQLTLKEAMRTTAFWILGTIIFCSGFAQQTLIVHVVPGATDMGISAAGAAVILSVMNFATITGNFGSGVIIDRIGGWLALMFSLVFSLLGISLLLGFREVWSLYLFAIIFGLSWGLLVISRSIIIADLFGLHSNGAITGAILFLYTIGGTIGPITAGYIFDVSGHYQIAFALIAILFLISIVMALPLRSLTRRPGKPIKSS